MGTGACVLSVILLPSGQSLRGETGAEWGEVAGSLKAGDRCMRLGSLYGHTLNVTVTSYVAASINVSRRSLQSALRGWSLHSVAVKEVVGPAAAFRNSPIFPLREEESSWVWSMGQVSRRGSLCPGPDFSLMVGHRLPTSP